LSPKVPVFRVGWHARYKITPTCSTSLSDNPPQIFDSAVSFQLENAIHQTASLLLFNDLCTSMNNPTGLTSLTFKKGHNYETLAWDKARIADLPKLQIPHQRPNPERPPLTA
jgi:hypothetical protein